MSRKLLSFFLCLIMLGSLIPVQASAKSGISEKTVSKSAVSTPAQQADPEDIALITETKLLMAQGVALVIKKNGTITSAYDKQGTLLTGDIDLTAWYIFGGSKGGTYTDTSITLESGTVRAIYGGGYSGTMKGNTEITIQGGTAGTVCGGNYYGTMIGNSSVTMCGGVVRVLYGSGYSATQTGTANMTLQGGTAGWAYGGSYAGKVVGKTNVIVKDDIRLWGSNYQNSTDNAPADDYKGTVFGAGFNDTVTTTNVLLLGGDYTWAYGGGESYGSGKSRVATTNVKLCGRPVSYANIFGGTLGGEVTTTNLEARNVPEGNKTLYLFGSGYCDSVTTANITFVGSCAFSNTEVWAACSAEGTTLTNANFTIDHFKLTGSRGTICGPLVGTGVTGKVSVHVTGAANPEEYLELQVKDVDSVKMDHSRVVLSGYEAYGNPQGELNLETLEIADAAEVKLTNANTYIGIGTLKGNGKITFQVSADGKESPTVMVKKIEATPSDPLKLDVVDYSGTADKEILRLWENGNENPAAEGVIVSALSGYTVDRAETASGTLFSLIKNTGADTRTETELTASFDKSSYVYGSAMRLKVEVKTTGGTPIANEQVVVGLGSANIPIASATLDGDGKAVITIPINNNMRDAEYKYLTVNYVGSTANKECSNRAVLAGGTAKDTRYTVTDATISLTESVNKPAVGQSTAQDLTPSADAFYTAEVVWTPGTADFETDMTYSADIVFKAKSGYDFANVNTTEYLSTAYTPQEQADGSRILKNVITYYPISITGGTVDTAYAACGEEVCITLKEPEEADETKYFSAWDVTPSVTLIGNTKLTDEVIRFTMPAEAVSAEPVYKTHPVIEASAGPNGTISPSGETMVTFGTNLSFIITPDSGFEVDQLKVDGSDVTPARSYTFRNVTENHTIAVTFKEKEEEPTATPAETAKPTAVPTESTEPTAAPTESVEPTAVPTESAEPTAAPTESTEPTAAPTESTEPTAVPTESAAPTELSTPTPTGAAAPSSETPQISETPAETTKPTESAELSTATLTPVQYQKNTYNLNVKSDLAWKKGKITIRWGKVSKAQGYEVRITECGGALGSDKTAGVVKGNKTFSYVITKADGKALDSKKIYKVAVLPYRTVNGKKVYLAQKMTFHMAGSGNKDYTNVQNVKVKKKSLTIKKGASKQIAAVLKTKRSDRKLLPQKHAPKFRYLSSDPSIASVNKKGKVTAKKCGTCRVVVKTVNGKGVIVKIRVKKAS